jgi:hypothetical protein
MLPTIITGRQTLPLPEDVWQRLMPNVILLKTIRPDGVVNAENAKLIPIRV